MSVIIAIRGILPLARHSARAVPRPVQSARLARSYATSKQPSTTSQFYKTFTRPVAKVLVLAVFTYQVVYWSWVKLEADEVRAETDATIAELEAKVGAYDVARTGDDKGKGP